jgi:hypothetical protein
MKDLNTLNTLLDLADRIPESQFESMVGPIVSNIVSTVKTPSKIAKLRRILQMVIQEIDRIHSGG